MSSSKIQLKPVGKLPPSTRNFLKMKRASFDPKRETDKFQGQITPSFKNSEDEKDEKQPLQPKKYQLGKRKRENLNQFKFKLIEDPRQSQFSYRKYILMEKMLLVISIFSFFVAVVNTEMYVLQETTASEHQITTEVEKISSLITTFLIFATLIRYVCINQLEIDQKKFYCIRTGQGIFYQIYRFFQHKEGIKYFFLEVLIILPHPFFLFHDVQIQILETYDKLMLKHRLNDLLSMASLCRIYIVMRSILNLTLYSTPRASRLCSHNRVQHSLLYTVKCLLKEQPVKIITLVFLINQIALGFGLRLSEGSLVYHNPQISLTGFQNYINCYWCVFITMATVGYGDYYPKTLPGRVIGLFAAASGIILSSLLIVSLSAYLTMQANQAKSHLTLVRLQHQEKLKQEATQALIQTMRMTKYLSSQQKSNDGKIKHFFTTLKHKIDLVKFRSRKIKSLVNNSNIIEEMNRLFELFKDNLQQSFRNQVQLKESLEKLNTNSANERKMQTVFLTHNMEEIISKKL